jgi:RIP metalloprotease RseP
LVLAGALVALGVWKGWALVVVILAFVVMIFLHELGHFMAGKWAGMKVTQFFLGFGPTLWSVQRGETEVGIKAIPAGAFVKVPGMMRDEPVAPEDEPRTYREAPFYKRVVFAGAGSAMHFLLAIILLFCHAFFVGNVDPERWVVDTVFPGGAAEAAGIKPGDRIVSVAGVKTPTAGAMGAEISKRPGETVPVEIERNGRTLTLQVSLGARSSIIGTVNEDINVFFGPEAPFVVVKPHGVAATAGAQDGDRLESVNAKPVSTPAELSSAVDTSKGGDVVLGLDRNGAKRVVRVDLGSKVGTTDTAGQIGIQRSYPSQPESLVGSGTFAVSTFRDLSVETVRQMPQALSPSNLAALFTRAATTSPTGPEPTITEPTPEAVGQAQELEANSTRPMSLVGSVDLISSFTEQSWGQLFYWMAIMNVFIGFFNLIPLLPFDGGHIMIACYEKVREVIRGDGRRYLVDPAKVYPVAVAVISVLGLLFLSSMYLDIVDPLRVG